jgi:FtsH-binding integral membrane protein
MNQVLDQDQSFSQELSRDFFKSVYSYMFGALAVSGIVAYLAGTPEFAFKYFYTVSPSTGGISPTLLYYIVAFAPVGLGLLIQMAYRRLSMGMLLLAFGVYSVLMGLSLSVILLIYSPQSVAVTFMVTSAAFGAMAVLGYTTKTDLTKMGSLLYMAFIGIFIAAIANWFIGSEMIDYIISIIGVFVFTGLTAYYMQRLKAASQDMSLTGIERNKVALVGGLMLYIMFINLFLSLLRLLGND